MNPNDNFTGDWASNSPRWDWLEVTVKTNLWLYRAILTGATRGVAQHENGEETFTNSEPYQTPETTNTPAHS